MSFDENEIILSLRESPSKVKQQEVATFLEAESLESHEKEILRYPREKSLASVMNIASFS